MKKLVFLLFTMSTIIVSAGNNQLDIGDKASHTDVKMQCVSGAILSLDDLKKDNGLLVIFSCNSCPFVLKWQDRYNELQEFANQNNMGMVVLNSNYQARQGGESYKAMKEHAKKNAYNFPYLVDKESLLANNYGGKTTPHVFLFDGDFKLAYKGAIDDNYANAKSVSKPYLKDAINSLASNELIQLAETKPIGCSIKRKLD